MNNNFKHHLIAILLKDDRLKDEQGELKGNLVKEFVNTLDENLITILLEDEKTRAQFFLKIKDAYVFKTNEFKFFLDENSIDNSFTQYSNQIGLATGGKFLKDNTDVVLNFPFKDCVLEGGQSTEDGLDTYFEYDETQEDYIEKQSKRKEIFFNEVLAKDEIDRLLEPKAFTNITKYDSKGESKPTQFNRNAKGTITDNLIIKGNNLLALHSLKQEFKGKVKLIYIDPPYNTGNDSFAYNDNFNHSTWLTFMRNRLMVAKDLLSEDGVIFVQCSFHQFAFLKVLMLDVFNKHLCDFNIQVRHPDRSLTGDKEYNDVIEYILIFSNDINKKMPYKEEIKTIDDYTLKIEINENEKPIEIIKCGNKNVEVYTANQYKVISTESHKSNLKSISIRGSIREKNSSGRFFVKYLEPLNHSPQTLFKVPDMGDDAVSYRYFYSAPQGRKNGGYFQGMPTSSNVTKKQYSNFYNYEKEYNNVAKQGGVSFRNGKKPEELLGFLIETFTTEKDIVLDYHLGSGTTGAVAQKLNRQYIGCEQIDNQIELLKKRLQNVIDGEQSGVSKAYNWKGGGSFIYLELAKNNQTAKEEILKCKNLEELLQYFETMYTHYFLHYNVRIKQFKEVISQEENFKNLALERQKEIFSKMLDLNQLYVNLSEIEDSRYNIDAKDIGLSKDFYQIKK
jgi:adenine-specific DNA-methyltransferase